MFLIGLSEVFFQDTQRDALLTWLVLMRRAKAVPRCFRNSKLSLYVTLGLRFCSGVLEALLTSVVPAQQGKLQQGRKTSKRHGRKAPPNIAADLLRAHRQQGPATAKVKRMVFSLLRHE